MALKVERRSIGSGDKAIEIFDIIGRLDTPGSAQLRSTVQDAMKKGTIRIALNLAECIEIHKQIIGTLHSLARACIRAGGGFSIFGATGDVNEYIITFADRSFAPWYKTEREAIIAMGGEAPSEETSETPIVVAMGTTPIFRKLFWKLPSLGGRPIAKFDSINATLEFLNRRKIHSIIMEAGGFDSHDLTNMVKKIKSTPAIRYIGLFAVGPPSKKNIGNSLMLDGIDKFVPFVFTGEEIEAKLDHKAFYKKLEEEYKGFQKRRQQ